MFGGGTISGFLEKLFSMGMETAIMASSYKSGTEKIVALMKKFLNDGGTVSDFFKMVDVRAYDLSNKQSDIKLVKTIDFAGVYILHNQTKNTFFIGKSTHVIKKVERQFRGFENKDIYNDFKNNNKYIIRFFRLVDSDFDSIDDFENYIKNIYIK